MRPGPVPQNTINDRKDWKITYLIEAMSWQPLSLRSQRRKTVCRQRGQAGLDF